MATVGALRYPWHRLLHPYRTRVLCPPNLCLFQAFAATSGLISALVLANRKQIKRKLPGETDALVRQRLRVQSEA